MKPILIILAMFSGDIYTPCKDYECAESAINSARRKVDKLIEFNQMNDRVGTYLGGVRRVIEEDKIVCDQFKVMMQKLADEYKDSKYKIVLYDQPCGTKVSNKKSLKISDVRVEFYND